MISHKPGTLSQVLNTVADIRGSVLTINQGIPLQGIANVTISVETKEMTMTSEEFLNRLKVLPGINKIEILGQA